MKFRIYKFLIGFGFVIACALAVVIIAGVMNLIVIVNTNLGSAWAYTLSTFCIAVLFGVIVAWMGDD